MAAGRCGFDAVGCQKINFNVLRDVWRMLFEKVTALILFVLQFERGGEGYIMASSK
jgi:hypothetical protein